MLCNRKANLLPKICKTLFPMLLLFSISVQLSATSSLPNGYYSDIDTMSTTNSENSSVGDDLYIIKAVVYEIGILTDADNATNSTTEREEEVKLSFYDPPNNSNTA